MSRSLLGVFLVIGLVTSACGKKELLSGKSIVGSWKLVGLNYKGSATESAVSESTSNLFVLEANANVTYVVLSSGSKSVGTYKMEGEKLTFNWTSGSVQEYPGINASEDNIILIDANPAISGVDKRRYQRISEDDKNALFQKYNIK